MRPSRLHVFVFRSVCLFCFLCFVGFIVIVVLFLLDTLRLFSVKTQNKWVIFLGELATFCVFVHSFVCFVFLRIFSQALVYFRMWDFLLGQ